MTDETALTDDERTLLLTPCECGHTINDHGSLGNCWPCLDENRECEQNFEALLVERVGLLVAARVAAVGA